MASTEIIFSVQESPEGGYQPRALGYSIFTQADSLDELKTMVRDAVSRHFDAANKPHVIRLHRVRDEVHPSLKLPAMSGSTACGKSPLFKGSEL